MLSRELLKILACPACKRDLKYDPKESQLICENCRLKYPVKADIPIMLIDKAEKF